MNHHSMHSDELDAYAADLAPMREIEFEELDDVEIAVEVELLLAQMQATRYSGD